MCFYATLREVFLSVLKGARNKMYYFLHLLLIIMSLKYPCKDKNINMFMCGFVTAEYLLAIGKKKLQY